MKPFKNNLNKNYKNGSRGKDYINAMLPTQFPALVHIFFLSKKRKATQGNNTVEGVN